MMNPQHSCPSPGDESRLSVLFQWSGSVPSSEDCSCYSVHQTTESEPCVMSKTFIFHTAHSHTLAGDEMLLKMQSRRWDETLQRAVGLFHLCGNGPGRIHLVESGGCKEPLKDEGRTEIKLLYLLVVTPRSSSSSSVVTGESAVVMWILVEPRGAWWSLMEPDGASGRVVITTPAEGLSVSLSRLENLLLLISSQPADIISQCRRNSKTFRSMFCLSAQ